MPRTSTIRSSRRGGPTRQERQRLQAARDSRRSLELAQGRLESVDAALASARSSLRWLQQAARTVQTGEAHFRDHPLNLAHHVAGAADKCAALEATIAQLESERAIALAGCAEVAAQLVEARVSRQPQAGASKRDIGLLSDAE